MKSKDKDMLKRLIFSSLFSYFMYKIMSEKNNRGTVEFGDLNLEGAYSPSSLSIFLDRFTSSQINKIVQVAGNIGVSPNWLVALMGFETKYTFDPSIKNPFGYVGLIQFGAAAAKDLGTTTSALRKMSFETQMDYVERYFTVVNKRYLKYVRSIEDLYCVIIYPLALKKGLDWICGSQKSLVIARRIADNNSLFRDARGYMTRRSINAGLRRFYKRNFPKYYSLLFSN